LNDAQRKKAKLSIRLSLEFASNIMLVRDPQSRKQDELKTSTDAGMQTDLSEEQLQNADTSIRIRCDPDSKFNEESEMQLLKQLSPKVSTEAGIETDRMAEPSLEKAPGSIRFIGDVSENRNSPTDESLQGVSVIILPPKQRVNLPFFSSCLVAMGFAQTNRPCEDNHKTDPSDGRTISTNILFQWAVLVGRSSVHRS
jgi:hypothetical protein